MKWRSVLLPVSAAMLSIAAASAGTAESASCSAGTVRVWGDPADRALIEALQAAYRAKAPVTCFINSLYGSESPIAGVYTGVADIAFMAREVREPMERMAFEWARLDKPTVIDFAYGGLLADRPGAQLAVIVNPNNPVAALTLAQLDGIVGAEGLRSATPVRRWSDAGVTGPLGPQPLAVYGTAVDGVPMLFVRRHVMKNSRKWNPSLKALDSDAAVIAAVARHPGAIGIVRAGAMDRRVRSVPLSAKAGEAATRPEREAIIGGRYPLARTLSLVVDRSHGKALSPGTDAFIRFTLGADGQSIIANSGTHLPLSPADAARSLEKLQ